MPRRNLRFRRGLKGFSSSHDAAQVGRDVISQRFNERNGFPIREKQSVKPQSWCDIMSNSDISPDRWGEYLKETGAKRRAEPKNE